MRLIYDLGIRIYYLLILAASLYSPKAKQWIRGRKGLWEKIAGTMNPELPVLWFHCSSLGEFEQGRPVIEKIRREMPGKRILLTFFSPSGYEVRKQYTGADYIFYLPLDTAGNARRFLDLVPVEQAFFIKYEFWYHFLSGLKERKIPVCLVSGIFRQKQVFFRWYGGWFRGILKGFDHLFVQQESSLQLLGSIGISRASVSGDTRFDRVWDISKGIAGDERFLRFAGRLPVIVAGSTWPGDEEILAKYINESGQTCRWIIAPHEIHENGIGRLEGMLRVPSLRYTELGDELPEGLQLIIVNTIGILSSLYRYASIAYIGGGFGKGIHNTLEAATFGKPVLFGPRYRKFQEAVDLKERGAAFPVSSYEELRSILDGLLNEPARLKSSGQAAEAYVKSMLGASSRIVDYALKRMKE
jgi:3-deoxy-D-manno-octulosonic-acid transferase